MSPLGESGSSGPGVDTERPWPGLEAFPEAASAFFFGRERECLELFGRIRRSTTTMLFGQSGLGKTSLLQAGLFPMLRKSDFLPIVMRLDYGVTSVPPVAQMEATLRQALADTRLDCTPMQPDIGLWQYFHQVGLRLSSPARRPLVPVLVFDQFEEAFTLGLARTDVRERTQAFLTELANLMENRPSDDLEAQFDASPDLVEQYEFDRQPYRIVVSLREDYLAAIESLRARAPSLGLSRFRLTRLNGLQALDAITGPAPELISFDVAVQIIRFIGQVRREEPFGRSAGQREIEALEVEPALLSLFCQELNERRLKDKAARFTSDLVETGSHSVLEEFYERALADQPPGLRKFIEDDLIDKSGHRESVSLERAYESLRQEGIAPEVLDVLVTRRLLRYEERLQVTRVEIIHDLLVDVVRRSAANRTQRQVAGTGVWRGANPFRGLAPYRFEHAPIFFGRTAVRQSALDRLHRNAQEGHPFLLVLGADGVGKTSLIQAGLLPALLASPSGGATLWRHVVMHPAARPDDPVAALADALQAALPEARGIAEALSPPPSDGAGYDPAAPLVGALNALEAVAKADGTLAPYGAARLLLVVDQLEEIFFSDVLVAQREHFVACLRHFVESRRIFVVSAMRSAFWQRAVPELVKLSDESGLLYLLAPTPGELAEIIRKPAQAAGLVYEEHPATGVRLDAVIAADAAAEPGALPLVSFLLEALYVEDVTERGGRMLTYASYERLGQLRGAIAKRAEETFQALSQEEQAALPRVLRALVATAGDPGQTLITRAAPIDLFPRDSVDRRLVVAMIQARLLIASSEGSRAASVRPAHDALVTYWRRARNLLDQHQRDLVTRTLVERQYWRWRAARQHASLLLRDPDLATAVDLVRRWHGELEPDLQKYVQRSRRRDQLEVVTRVALSVAVGGIAFSGTLVGILALEQKGKFQRQTANSLREVSTIGPGGRILSVNGEGRGTLINLETGEKSVVEVPGPIEAAQFSPSGRLLALGLASNLALWDVADHKSLRVLEGAGTAKRIAFSPDESLVADANEGNGIRIWSVSTGSLLKQAQAKAQVVALGFHAVKKTLWVADADGSIDTFEIER